MSQSTIDIQGLETVRRAFKELEPRIARKVLRQAERKAAKLFAEEIKIHTPEATGKLKRTIKVRSSKGPRGSKRGQVSVAVLIGQAGGMVAAGAVKSAWYAYLQERGWMLGKRERSGGKVTGYGPAHGNLGAAGVRRIPGKFFTRRALHSKETPARILLIGEIAQGIEREAKALDRA